MKVNTIKNTQVKVTLSRMKYRLFIVFLCNHKLAEFNLFSITQNTRNAYLIFWFKKETNLELVSKFMSKMYDEYLTVTKREEIVSKLVQEGIIL